MRWTPASHRGDPFYKSWHAAELLLWLAAIAAFFVYPNYLPLATLVVIVALFALSLDLAMGYAGIVSLGHAAYFGLGAYVAAWLGKYGWTEPITGVLVAMVASGLLGLITARVVARGTELSCLLVTLGLGLLLFEAANKANDITGGIDGLYGVVIAPVLGLFEFDFAGKTGYWYSLCWLMFGLLVVRKIIGSPLGLTLRGIGLNKKRTAALGVDNSRALTIAYTISTALAGVAGALLTQTTQYVAIDVLAFHRSADVLTMLIIGGAGYLYGGILGAAAFIILQDLLSGMNPIYWQFWLGWALVVIVLFLPEGAFGSFQQLVRRRRPKLNKEQDRA
ncbi:branched-chain amino acid ABC transporter permease [Pusillimonas sp. DMV24BSW_D]|uniref:branched-chain amino acid ABC transporter permease n=1 Tax=Neopusillimonas aestuarii TaxID=2716226 RepID=UPI00140B775A|nr:branched-chain amino acid ABC transporter permease [Pusillimonas sp. DMV24BSW_D]QIM47736.1 branched-chain amino acid ABC transporter permease [Pusillimonas sp. DMV24BSW_D]